MSLMKTVGYIRVSTDKQADRGVSLDAQAEKIRAMAVVHGGELIDIIVDGGESAKTLNRPGMTRLLALVDSGGVQAVIVAKLDRLTRSVKDLCTLQERFERRGVALVSGAESLDTGSAAGRLVLNIMTAVSQWEREAIGERTRDALSHKRGKGERGNMAFGYRLADDGQHLELDPTEQAALTEIRRLRSDGMPLRGIAAALNHRTYRTRRGTAWRLESVARVLKQNQPDGLCARAFVAAGSRQVPKSQGTGATRRVSARNVAVLRALGLEHERLRMFED
jgi:site-specific DNA recombinase